MKLITLLALTLTAAFFEKSGGAFSLDKLFLLGAVINQGALNNVYNGFKTLFQDAYNSATSELDKLAVTVPSTTRQEEYKWLGQFPGLREWIGERVIKDLSVDGFTIKNRDFEATVSVDRNDIEDDSIALYKPLFEQLGETARQHPDELIFQLMTGGFSQTCFDGQLFFDTDHPNGDQGTWSNKGTVALDQTAYENARSAMMSLVNEEGKSLRVVPNVLIVPPQLDATARTILRADKQANGSTNIWKGSADIMVVAELSSNPTYWFMACTERAAKPFIFQSRRSPEFVMLDKSTDENAFLRKEYVYGVDYRGNAGLGLPHLMYGSTGGA